MTAAAANFCAAFSDLYRVLKPDSFCVCFYGWNRVDEFFSAWRAAGFRPAGHIVWKKEYSSSARFLQYRHEQAYLLARAIRAVRQSPWPMCSRGNTPATGRIPTEKAVEILKTACPRLFKAGRDRAGPVRRSGSTAVAAASLSGRRYVGIELEGRYCRHARTAPCRRGAYTAQKGGITWKGQSNRRPLPPTFPPFAPILASALERAEEPKPPSRKARSIRPSARPSASKPCWTRPAPFTARPWPCTAAGGHEP